MKSIGGPIVIGCVLVLLLGLTFFRSGHGDAIEYRGEYFKMARKYSSFEDFKDDPNNLAAEELTRIEKLMVDARLGPAFDKHEDFIAAVFDLKFPGYGMISHAEEQQPDGSTLQMVSVEIPQRDKDRYLVVRKTSNRYLLVDDFVAGTATSSVTRVELVGKKLIYHDSQGNVAREHEITP